MKKYTLTIFLSIFSTFLWSSSWAGILGNIKISKKAIKVDQKRSLNSASRSNHCQQNLDKVSIHLMIPEDKIAHQTISSRPPLYFYTDSEKPFTLRFTLVNPQKAEPLVDKSFETNQKGIQKIALPPKVKLQEKTIYLWNLAIACEDNYHQEVLSAGIERVNITDNTNLKVKNIQTNTDKIQAYAENGIWYEMLDLAVSDTTLNHEEIVNEVLYESEE